MVSGRTIKDLMKMKQQGKKIACLTAYDASFAGMLEEADVDIILVGDSLGMVVQGEQTTLTVNIEAMLYHTRCVSKAVKQTFVMADLPFMTYSSIPDALRNAGRLLSEAGAHMVKLEGGLHRAETISALVNEGIPVCAHLGLLPQTVHQVGGYKVQGRDPEAAATLLADAKCLEEAGASLLLLECIPADLAEQVTQQLSIPTIGIGAGADTDGQVLVLHDILGIGSHNPPRFSKNYLLGRDDIQQALNAYVDDVRLGRFPDAAHAFN